jgi:Ca2+-binding EF-hand superfamily protein
MDPPAAHGLSEDEVADLKEAFSMFDTDGGGTSSRANFSSYILSCNSFDD